MGVAVHQHRNIGSGAMIGMNSTVTHDIPDFALAYGNPARVHGANKVGLHQMGWTQEQIAQKAQDLSRSED
jgi:UDP-N-acetylglucosamine acyltransferase